MPSKHSSSRPNMFSNYFFLILLLILLSTTSERSISHTSAIPFFSALTLYAGLLATLYFFARKWQGRSGRFIFFSNILLLLFIFSFFYLFQAQNSFFLPAFVVIPFALALYFFGLFTAHCGLHSVSEAKDSVRFLLPLPLPYLFFILLNSLISFVPLKNTMKNTISFLPLLSLLISLMLTVLLLPPTIVWAWGCCRLKDQALEQSLQQFCKKAGFVHAGFRQWNMMRETINAAILGMAGRFRYILFTEALLERLPLESIQAILSHEIGHSRHRHLLFYPIIFSGMLLTAAAASLPLSRSLSPFFHGEGHRFSLSHGVWDPLLFFLAFALFAALYFRYLFGHFSRLFERQADLQIFALGVPPKQMIRALNESSGSILGRKRPNWHHYSIQERVEFIENAADNPWLISSHHRKVRMHLTILLFFLAGAIFYVFRN